MTETVNAVGECGEKAPGWVRYRCLPLFPRRTENPKGVATPRAAEPGGESGHSSTALTALGRYPEPAFRYWLAGAPQATARGF